MPSSISSAPLIQSYALPPETGLGSAATPREPRVVNSFLEKLNNLAKSLPDTIPVASTGDVLAKFGQDPANFDDEASSVDNLWEEEINPQLKRVLGWGTEGNMKVLIQRGKKGVEGLATYATYFVEKRGISESLFEGKLSHLVLALEEMCFRKPFVVTRELTT